MVVRDKFSLLAVHPPFHGFTAGTAPCPTFQSPEHKADAICGLSYLSPGVRTDSPGTIATGEPDQRLRCLVSRSKLNLFSGLTFGAAPILTLRAGRNRCCFPCRVTLECQQTASNHRSSLAVLDCFQRMATISRSVFRSQARTSSRDRAGSGQRLL
jgi:hypothetical protein